MEKKKQKTSFIFRRAPNERIFSFPDQISLYLFPPTFIYDKLPLSIPFAPIPEK
jgi:hypothetical protein